MSGEPGAAGEQQGDLVSRLRAAVEAKDAETSALRAGLEDAGPADPRWAQVIDVEGIRTVTDPDLTSSRP